MTVLNQPRAAKVFALLVLLGYVTLLYTRVSLECSSVTLTTTTDDGRRRTPLFTTRNGSPFSVIDGVGALAHINSGGHLDATSWWTFIVRTLAYAQRVVAEAHRVILCAMKMECDVPGGFHFPAFADGEVEARMATKAAQLHEAFGEHGTKEICAGCLMGVFGSVKWLMNGDIGPFGMLAGLELAYSLLGASEHRFQICNGAYALIVSGVVSSGYFGRRPAARRVKRD